MGRHLLTALCGGYHARTLPWYRTDFQPSSAFLDGTNRRFTNMENADGLVKTWQADGSCVPGGGGGGGGRPLLKFRATRSS